MFEEFCGSPFWDADNVTELTSENENDTVPSAGPDLTLCFQDTALIWIPCGFLFAIAPFYIWTLKRREYHIPHTWLNIMKTLLSLALMLLAAANIAYKTHEYMIGENQYPAHVLAPVITCLAMGVSIFIIQYGRIYAVRKTGFLFIYWLLQTVASILILQSFSRAFIHAQHLGINPPLYGLVYIVIFLTLVFIQLILSALFVDKDPINWDPHKQPNPCPEMSANFLSTITFWWFSGLLIQGYKKDLTREDLWTLNPQDLSNSVVPKFEYQWNKQKLKIQSRSARKGKKSKKGDQRDKDESNLTMTRNGSVQLQLLNSDPDQKVLNEKAAKPTNGTSAKSQKYLESLNDMEVEVEVVQPQTHPRLWVVLMKGFYKTFLFGAFLKLIHDILMFCSPLLLKQMIRFVVDTSIPTWHGYLYCFLMFIVALIESMLLHQYFHRCMVVGMRVRTAIVACVYRKSLKLSSAARKTSTVGEIVNLMSVDAQRFMELTTYLNMLWSAPFQMCVCLYFLWMILGPAILAGVGVMILMIPINAYIAKKSRALQVKQMKYKDVRIKLMNEVLNGIKVLKLYAWELSFQKKVLAIRDQELDVLRKAAYLNAASSFTWTCAPFLVSLTTFAVYVLSDERNVLDAEKAFVSLSLFNILRFPLSMLPMLIANLVQTSVSVKRLQNFLISEELDTTSVDRRDDIDCSIEVTNGSFRWDRSIEKPTLEGINLRIEEGSFVGIVGQVGSGKSTLLSAMLGETERLGGNVAIKGSVAYVAQQAWIQNATVENNILFYSPKRSDEYERVIDCCALRQDINDLPGGDQTEIGEKGINISGGQKQRVSLARAAYFDADVYLFDDPLSAVDSHVGKHIFDNLLSKNGMLKNKTRVLVTHGISYLPQLDKIIVMVDGKISEVGTYLELLKQNGAFAEFLRTYLEKEELEEDDIVDEGDLELRGEILSRLESFGESSVQIKDAFDKLQRIRRDTSRSSDQGSVGTPTRTMSSPLKFPQPNGDRQKMLRSVSTDSEARHRADDADKEAQDEDVTASSKLLKDGVDADGVAKSRQFLHSMSKDSRVTKKSDTEKIGAAVKSENKRLIQDEKAETGGVNPKVFLMYLKSIGVLVSIAIVILYILNNIASVYSNIWLSQWSNDKPVNGTVDVKQRDMRLGVYGALGFSQGLFILLAAFALAEGSLRSSAQLHLAILQNGLRSPMQFFDSTPIGRIINRFSKDIDVIDTMVPRNLDVFLKCSLAVFSTLFVISFSTPLFLAVIFPMGIMYFLVQRFYVATSRQLRRIESISRSPIYSHFGETVQGAMTIRAYNQQNRFILESDARVDENQVSYYPGIVSHRWLATRLEFVGNSLVMFAALFAVIGRDHLSGGIIGLSISYALNITQTLNWMVRMSSELETNIVAVERVKEYSETPTEAAWRVEEKKPDEKWPPYGVVEFRDYSTRYRENLEPVLKNLTCNIKGGEKIGIVGRTGAGKSSLTLGLFRIIEPSNGSIFIDGVNIAEIGLHDLRSKLTIIPQDPVLFSGSLRMNLDPFDEHPDEDLWHALEHAHLKNTILALPDKLMHECSEGGENLSVGQRQLVCLARALLRRTKVLVLDEATAAVDLETDDLIQSTIRTQFADSTVLTIAHRINTILDYTRIMVLDKGLVKEFDAPQVLLSNKDSIFYGLAKDANIVE